MRLTCSRALPGAPSSWTGRSGPPGICSRVRRGPAVSVAPRDLGDIPIVLVQIDEPDDVGIVRQLLRAHEYWRLKQLPVDLVILNERAPSYVQDLQSLLETLVRTSQSAAGSRWARAARQRLHSAAPTASRPTARCPAHGGPRRAVESPRDAGRADRTRAPGGDSAGRCPAAAAPAGPPQILRCPRSSLKSSTAWEASPPTGESM